MSGSTINSRINNPFLNPFHDAHGVSVGQEKVAPKALSTSNGGVLANLAGVGEKPGKTTPPPVPPRLRAALPNIAKGAGTVASLAAGLVPGPLGDVASVAAHGLNAVANQGLQSADTAITASQVDGQTQDAMKLNAAMFRQNQALNNQNMQFTAQSMKMNVANTMMGVLAQTMNAGLQNIKNAGPKG